MFQFCRSELQDLSEGQIKTLDLDEPVGHFLQCLKVVGGNVTTAEDLSKSRDNDDPPATGAPNSSLAGPSNHATGSSSAAVGGANNSSNLFMTASFASKQNAAAGGATKAANPVRGRAPISVMGLSGKDLYRCGMTGE